MDVVKWIVSHSFEWWDESLLRLLTRGHLAVSHTMLSGLPTTDRISASRGLCNVLDVVNSIAVEINYTMEEIFQMNIDKLTARSEQDKLGGSGDDREEIITTK